MLPRVDGIAGGRGWYKSEANGWYKMLAQPSDAGRTMTPNSHPRDGEESCDDPLEAQGGRRYGDPIGPPATITREPGQIRKEAATAGTLCAGVWLVGLPP